LYSFNWKQVIHHPFWENRLKHMMPLKSIIVDGKEQLVEDEEKRDLLLSLTERPRTAAGASLILDQKPEVNASFSVSSRLPVSPQSTMQTRNALQCKESDVQSSTSTLVGSQVAAADRDELAKLKSNEARQLFFMPSELSASQIIDNPKIQKPVALKFEPKVLPVANAKAHKADTFLKLPRDEFNASVDAIKANTNVPGDKSAGAMKIKLHLMNYVGSLCNESSKMADAFVQAELYKELLLVIKNGYHVDMYLNKKIMIFIQRTLK
jgi:hypothetical protein